MSLVDIQDSIKDFESTLQELHDEIQMCKTSSGEMLKPRTPRKVRNCKPSAPHVLQSSFAFPIRAIKEHQERIDDRTTLDTTSGYNAIKQRIPNSIMTTSVADTSKMCIEKCDNRNYYPKVSPTKKRTPTYDMGRHKNSVVLEEPEHSRIPCSLIQHIDCTRLAGTMPKSKRMSEKQCVSHSILNTTLAEKWVYKRIQGGCMPRTKRVQTKRASPLTVENNKCTGVAQNTAKVKSRPRWTSNHVFVKRERMGPGYYSPNYFLSMRQVNGPTIGRAYRLIAEKRKTKLGPGYYGICDRPTKKRVPGFKITCCKRCKFSPCCCAQEKVCHSETKETKATSASKKFASKNSKACFDEKQEKEDKKSTFSDEKQSKNSGSCRFEYKHAQKTKLVPIDKLCPKDEAIARPRIKGFKFQTIRSILPPSKQERVQMILNLRKCAQRRQNLNVKYNLVEQRGRSYTMNRLSECKPHIHHSLPWSSIQLHSDWLSHGILKSHVQTVQFNHSRNGSILYSRKARHMWHGGQIHTRWAKQNNLDGIRMMKNQMGRDEIQVYKKDKKTIQPFGKPARKKSTMGPGTYDAPVENTFDDIQNKRKGIDFSKGTSRNLGRTSNQTDNDTGTLDLEVDDAAIRPRIRSYKIMQSTPKVNTQELGNQLDLEPNLDYNRKPIVGVQMSKQLGRDWQKNQNESSSEQVALNVQYDAVAPRIKGAVSFDKMTTKHESYRYTSDETMLQLEPKYDLGWSGKSNYVHMAKALDRWHVSDRNTNAPDAEYDVSRADGISSKYTRTMKGIIDMKKSTSRNINEPKQRETELQLEPQYDVQSKYTRECVPNLKNQSERWKMSPIVETSNMLDLKIRDSYLSTKRSITHRVAMHKGRERFESNNVRKDN